MRKRLMTGLLAGAVATLLVVGPAAADPQPNGHNCAGFVVSGAAAPGFGTGVAAAAQLQGVDNFGLANCGAPPRQNP